MPVFTEEDIRLVELEKHYPEFRQELNELFTLYKHTNFRLLSERIAYREAEHAFNEKWQCNFATFVFHYHRIMDGAA